MQEQHDLADHLLIRPATDNPFGALRANTRHLPQAMRFLLDQIEHGLAERFHQFLRINRPNAPDHARAKITFDALDRGRRAGLEELGLELEAVGMVVEPAPRHLHKLARRNHGGMADDSDQIALSPHLHAQDAETVLCIVERHPFHKASQRLGRRSRAAQRDSPASTESRGSDTMIHRNMGSHH
ncbi:hypothetical protein GLUCOINTEAF2_0203878 [Komagataeibacter intermedius AF2]|uniref:Uncharacterized protein n=1 Tax=Komagataeibacter intermedius AF2 TaxID=1458464 RepID=A0A0N0MG25_9PROT|nr:hypothetical protein GLUCOINTEAF2_0203878 [Komagataeibacter intermedius AF2]